MSKKPSVKCDHKFQLISYTLNCQVGSEVAFRCAKCGAGMGIPADAAFAKAANEEYRSNDQQSEDLHATWYRFCAEFLDHGKWKLQGGDLISAVEQWAQGHPDVHLVHCDDAYHSNALLVLVEHGVPGKWMGLTVLMLPQCAPDPPAEFFLYPGAAANLYLALAPKRFRQASKPRTTPERKAVGREARRLLRGWVKGKTTP
jgi:hypothetical protein